MATFVEEFKDYKLLELSAKRHISLASELGRIVKQHGLTTISALEQSLACSNDHANQLKELMRIIEDPNVGARWECDCRRRRRTRSVLLCCMHCTTSRSPVASCHRWCLP